MYQQGGLTDADLVRWVLGATTSEERKAAFEAIAGKYRQDILRQCARWYPDPDIAQDVGQAAFEAAFTLLTEGQGPAVPDRLGGWLIEIARRRGQEYIRKRRPAGVYWAELPEGRGLEETEDDDESRSGSASRRAHVTRLVDRVVTTMTEQQQEIYRLRFVEGLTGRQAAARLGISDKAASNEATIVQKLIADGFGALILMQEGRTYCPDLARILDDAAATRATAVAISAFATPPDMYVFTTVLRQRIVNHFNDCNVCDNCRTCDEKRRQLAGPYAPALTPILFAAEFRDRIDEVIRRVTARGHPGETTPGQGPLKKVPAVATAGALLAMTGAAVRSSPADAFAGRVQSIVRAVSQSSRTPRWLRRALPQDPSPRMSMAMVIGAIAAVIVFIVVVAVTATGGSGTGGSAARAGGSASQTSTSATGPGGGTRASVTAANDADVRVEVVRTGDSISGGPVAGPDGRIWTVSFTPNSAPVLQTVNPTTYAVSTYPLPTAIGGKEVGYNGIGAFDDAGHLWLNVNVSPPGQQPTTYLLRYTMSTASADLFPEDGHCMSGEVSSGQPNQLYAASDGAIWVVCQAETGNGSYYFRISPEGAITETHIVNNALDGSALWTDIEDLPNGTQDGAMAAGPGGTMWGISSPLTVRFTASSSEIPVTDSTDFFGAAAAELLGDGTTVEGFFANCPANGQTNPNSPACFGTLSADGSTYTPIANAPGTEDDLTTGGREPIAAMNEVGDAGVVMYGTMGGTSKEVQYYFGVSSGGATRAVPFTVPGDAAPLPTDGESTAMTSDGGLWMVDTAAGSNGGALVEILPKA